VPGGRVTLRGRGFDVSEAGPPRVTLKPVDESDAQPIPARVLAASPDAIVIAIPDEPTGSVWITLPDQPGVQARLEVGRVLTTGVHQVDNPAFDLAGRLWVTQSGGRDTKASVPLYRVGRNGVREPLSIEVGNPTSLALAPDGAMFVSSRFDGHVYRISADDSVETYASDLGGATGLAFAPDGTLYVGDRTGSIFRVSPDRRVENIAKLPSSVAAFHLAFGPDGDLYVATPTLATHDAIYRVTPTGSTRAVTTRFGRPQGLAFDRTGALFAVDALAGSAGLYRVPLDADDAVPTLALAAPTLVGIAFDPLGGMVLASSDTIWRLD
jgi:sugar lactone lactonase YvrE